MSKQQRDKNKMLGKFYNYKYWREEQRKQLTIASNVYFGFGTALIGYSINLLINDKQPPIDCCVRILLITGITFNILSLVFYVLLTNNKLEDYKKTAELIKDVKNKLEDISSKTKQYGNKTWKLFEYQKISLIVGFVFCLMAYLILIFQK